MISGIAGTPPVLAFSQDGLKAWYLEPCVQIRGRLGDTERLPSVPAGTAISQPHHIYHRDNEPKTAGAGRQTSFAARGMFETHEGD